MISQWQSTSTHIAILDSKNSLEKRGNKDLLIDFLNQLLPEHHQIADLNFRNFDIHCKALSGERFIVEMQKAKVKYFKDRSLFYVTFPIRDQAQQGDWNFRLESIYFVAILDFEYDETEERRKFRRDVALKDQDGDVFFDKLQFNFLQMPLFNKKENELKNKFDKWCFFLKNLEAFDHIPSILNEPIFQKAFETAELAGLSSEQLDRYEQNLIQYRDLKSALETAVEERDVEIAKRMILAGSDDNFINKITDLSLEYIGKLRAELKKQNR